MMKNVGTAGRKPRGVRVAQPKRSGCSRVMQCGMYDIMSVEFNDMFLGNLRLVYT